MRPALLYALDKSIDKRVILGASNSMTPPTDVDGALQPLFIVCSHVQQDRETILWMNPAQRGVKRQFSDRNAHASSPLIAQPKNSFSVADDNTLYFVVSRMTQNLRDTVPIWVAEKQSSRLSPYLAETLTAFADRRGVDQREHLFNI